MSLEKAAQHIEVIEFPLADHMIVEPEQTLTVGEMPEEEHSLSGLLESQSPEEVSEGEPEEFEITLDELPGAGRLNPELEKALEVSEDEDTKNKKDKNELAEKPVLKWDWEARWKKDGASGFFSWAKEILDNIPKHSGYNEAGIHRVVSYLERFCDELSKAMKKDLDGELDASKIEKMCAEAEDGIERCNARLEKLKRSKKTKKAEEENAQLIKTAQKAPTVVGIVITVPLLISSIARTCINSMVSAGHDIESVLDDQVKKYKLTEREQMELIQHLLDLNVPIRKDMGYLRDEDLDTTQGKYNWMSQYQA